MVNVSDISKANIVQCFAFNADSSRIAISSGNESVEIYNYKNGAFDLACTLEGHNSRVYSMDWSKKTNKLVTCAADRNAYVWSEIGPNDWKPSLVLLRINRAAICVKWSPLENKFAVGTGSKLVCICFYEESNDWWVSKHMKKPIVSSVLALDWHPDNSLLAVGSSDFTCRVYSAAVKEVDKKPTVTVWGDKFNFGTTLAEFKSKYGGWVHSVAFSPSGNQLAWTTHDSCVNVADYAKANGYTFTLKMSMLPFMTCIWRDDSSIIVAGHDNKPYELQYKDGVLKFGKCIDEGPKKSTGSNSSLSAMNKFKNLDTRAQDKGVTREIDSTHVNTIVQMSRLHDGRIASSALDPKIAIWNK